MPRKIFQKILQDASKRGIISDTARKSARWFQRKARSVRTTPKEIWAERERWKRVTQRSRLLGNMYFFFYEPQGKDTLPYWDAFPLVIPIELTQDGFLGINFHYLDWRYRAFLMDRILELEREEPDPQDTEPQSQSGKLDWRKIRYERLSALNRYKYFKPCLKHYKFTNMRSRMIQVEKTEWDIALFLPLERFQKKRKNAIWEDSRNAF